MALCHSGLRLILQPISKPAVNELPLVANRTEIEKVRRRAERVRAFNKLARTFAAQVETLKRHRGGGEQVQVGSILRRA